MSAPEETAASGSMLSPALAAQMVPDRSCGSCSMCCKVFNVPWVENKPAGQWCKHCKPGKGCGIWETRPTGCRTYYCQWFFAPALGPEWRPDTAKFIINLSKNDFWLEIVADHAQPNAWKREPYHSLLRQKAGERMAAGKGMMLHILDKRYIITPTDIIDIAQFPADSEFVMSASNDGGRMTYHVQVITGDTQ